MKHKGIILAILLMLVTACKVRSVLSPALPSSTAVVTLSPPASSALTPIPIPKYTPISTPSLGPASARRSYWPILFSGTPALGAVRCDEGLLLDGEPPMAYRVNSDGTGLTPLAEVRELPTSLIGIDYLQFSSAGKRISYVADWQIVMANADGSDPILVGAVPDDFVGFGLLPVQGCVAVFRKPEETVLVIEQACAGEAQRQTLGTTRLPPLPNGWRYDGVLKISPDGRRLLAYGRVQGGSNVRLYVIEIGSDEAPRVLFDSTPSSCAHHSLYGAGPARWRDNSTIEFVTLSTCGTLQNTVFHQLELKDGELEDLLDLPGEHLGSLGPDVIGDWSPDGSEFVIAYDHDPQEQDSLEGWECGLYVVDLNTGKQQQVTSQYWINDVLVWQPSSLQR